VLEDATSVARRKREHILFEPPACSALLARCYLAIGHLDRAAEWVEQITSETFSNPLNAEQNQISVARVQVAMGKPEEATATLVPLRLSAEKDQHYRHLAEIQLVYSEALAAEGKYKEAEQMLSLAVQRAADAGFMRLLAEESQTVQRMCLTLPALQAPGRWNKKIMNMLREQTEKVADPGQPTVSAPAPGNQNDQLTEPLSQREIQVLELINRGLANKDIATNMGVAPTTVKAHIRNLYGKLGVGSRTEALARARTLGLLN
jgi:LuxR family maltose regulon positive regulatory protein